MTVYLLHTAGSGGRPLEAWSLEELAELIECALAAGDPLERLRAASLSVRTAGRPLSPGELERLLVLLGG